MDVRRIPGIENATYFTLATKLFLRFFCLNWELIEGYNTEVL